MKTRWRLAIILILFGVVAIPGNRECTNTHLLSLQAIMPLAVLNTKPDGAGTVQTIGPLKTLVGGEQPTSASDRRYLIITELKDSTKVVLRQTSG